MKTAILLLLVSMANADVIQPERFLGFLENQIRNSAKEAWIYSGSGGYVFKYELDLVGDGKPEKMVALSFNQGIWHIFTSDKTPELIGDIHSGGLNPLNPLNPLNSAKTEDVTLLSSPFSDNHDNPPLEKFKEYILETRISREGISKEHREVGKDATRAEYDALADRRENDAGGSTAPTVYYASMRSFVDGNPEWREIVSEEWLKMDYFYHKDIAETVARIKTTGDEDEMAAAVNGYTKDVTLGKLSALRNTLRPSRRISIQDTASEQKGSSHNIDRRVRTANTKTSVPLGLWVIFAVSITALALAAWRVLNKWKE